MTASKDSLESQQCSFGNPKNPRHPASLSLHVACHCGEPYERTILAPVTPSEGTILYAETQQADTGFRAALGLVPMVKKIGTTDVGHKPEMKTSPKTYGFETLPIFAAYF
jgi:hypothetical protein